MPECADAVPLLCVPQEHITRLFSEERLVLIRGTHLSGGVNAKLVFPQCPL